MGTSAKTSDFLIRCKRALQAVCPLFLVLFLTSLSDAEPRTELIVRMEELRASIIEQELAASEAERKSQEANRELKLIKSDLDKHRKEEQRVINSLSDLEKSQKVAESDRSKLSTEQERIRKKLFERIRAVYLVPKASVLAYVVDDQDAVSLGLVNNYLEALYTHDMELVAKLRALGSKIDQQSSSINASLAKQKTLAAELKQRRAAIAQRLAAQERLTTLARTEKNRREEAVGSLRAKLLRFESTLSGLTGGTYEVSEGDASSVRSVDESFDGPGLTKGAKAPLPADGRIVTKFKGQRTDGQVSKGIEIATAGLAPVRAIAPARVVFVGSLPGLDTSAVLDHGERSFSLYGRLGAVSCSVGSELAVGDLIGEADGAKPLYFEVRQAGIAIDPRSIVSLK